MGILEYLSANLPAIAPEIGLTILAMVILLVDSYRPDAKSNIGYLAAIVMALLAITPFIPGWSPAMGESSLKWGGMIRHDMLASIFKVMILFAGSITSLMAVKDSAVGQKGEFYLIITISTLGASLLAASADIVMLFVALETVSIPLYILAGFSHSGCRSPGGKWSEILLIWEFRLCDIALWTEFAIRLHRRNATHSNCSITNK
ncbi:MAG: hypothetical protein Q9P01_18300 [Anaerolineae bacterium]|nr:hypothetical protein [Anaerolineae bacterium]